MVKYQLLSIDHSINEQGEKQYIEAHPLLEGNTDVDQIIDKIIDKQRRKRR